VGRKAGAGLAGSTPSGVTGAFVGLHLIGRSRSDALRDPRRGVFQDFSHRFGSVAFGWAVWRALGARRAALRAHRRPGRGRRSVRRSRATGEGCAGVLRIGLRRSASRKDESGLKSKEEKALGSRETREPSTSASPRSRPRLRLSSRSTLASQLFFAAVYAVLAARSSFFTGNDNLRLPSEVPRYALTCCAASRNVPGQPPTTGRPLCEARRTNAEPERARRRGCLVEQGTTRVAWSVTRSARSTGLSCWT